MAKKHADQHKTDNQPTKQSTTKITIKHQSAKPDKTAKSDKLAKKAKKLQKSKSAQATEEKPLRQVFILARPFVAIGRYLRDSWRELRLVRWPSRGNTWKMTLAVLAYCAIFIVSITLVDSFFTFIFNLLLNQQ